MDIEWEAKFLNVAEEKIRAGLQELGAGLVKPKQLYRRIVFFLPQGHEIDGGWLRVRDEGDKVTMSLKAIANGKIETQREVMLVVDDYDKAEQFLTEIGCVKKAYQETKREIWSFKDMEITIDEWPYLEPHLEIEGSSEEEVKKMSEMLGLDYSSAVFGTGSQVIAQKYHIPEEAVNNEIPRIVFGEKNPYLAWRDKDKG